MLNIKSSQIKNSISRRLLFFALLQFLLYSTKESKAQLSPFQSSYFQNQYLSNPAMAGLEKGLTLNLGYQKQVTGVPGEQNLQSFTADYGIGNKIGVGLSVYNDQAGLISRTRVMGTYAYHLPLTNTSKLNFGLSFGINDRSLDYSKVVGDASDVQAQYFNQRNIYADGDLGISYTTRSITVQAAVPNLRTTFFSSDADGGLSVDRPTFYTAASYKVFFKDSYSIEPKVAVRGIKGFDDIVDAGLNFNLREYGINLLGIYHSSKSATYGFSIDLKTVDLLLSYTNSTGQLQGYNNNMFEAGVKVKLFN